MTTASPDGRSDPTFVVKDLRTPQLRSIFPTDPFPTIEFLDGFTLPCFYLSTENTAVLDRLVGAPYYVFSFLVNARPSLTYISCVCPLGVIVFRCDGSFDCFIPFWSRIQTSRIYCLRNPSSQLPRDCGFYIRSDQITRPRQIQNDGPEIRKQLSQSVIYRTLFKITFPNENEAFKLLHFLSLVISAVCSHVAFVRSEQESPVDASFAQIAGLENRAVRDCLVEKNGFVRRCLICGRTFETPARWMDHLIRTHTGIVTVLDESCF
jgi:hypothetical protein